MTSSRWNEYTPQWAIEYIHKYWKSKEKDADNPNNAFTFTLELVRDTIYNYFKKANKILSKEKKEKIHWLVWCNYNYKKYCDFIDYNAKKGMLP